jgi:opacity protein-like surface antigen
MMAVSAAGAASVSPYASAKLGLGSTKLVSEMGPLTMESDSSTVYGGAIAVGASVKLNDSFAVRGEVEGGLNDHVWSDGSFLAATVGANLYLDWKATNEITPYVGAGIGYGFVGSKIDGINDSYDWEDKGGLNYNFGLGVAYAMNKNLSLDLGARYVSQIVKDDEILGMTVKQTLESYVVQFGARYAF